MCISGITIERAYRGIEKGGVPFWILQIRKGICYKIIG